MASLEWFQIYRGTEEAGELLAAFEMFEVSVSLCILPLTKGGADLGLTTVVDLVGFFLTWMLSPSLYQSIYEFIPPSSNLSIDVSGISIHLYNYICIYLPVSVLIIQHKHLRHAEVRLSPNESHQPAPALEQKFDASEIRSLHFIALKLVFKAF